MITSKGKLTEEQAKRLAEEIIKNNRPKDKIREECDGMHDREILQKIEENDRELKKTIMENINSKMGMLNKEKLWELKKQIDEEVKEYKE